MGLLGSLYTHSGELFLFSYYSEETKHLQALEQRKTGGEGDGLSLPDPLGAYSLLHL